MKIIDLLKKAANGEEVPKKIKYNNYIYEFYEEDSDYRRESTKGFYTLLYDLEYICKLTDEIEIIEEVEDKEYEDIEEIEDNHNFYSYSEYEARKHEIDKITYILRGINEATDMAVKNANKINALIRNQKYILERLDKNEKNINE